jgi:DNA ligase-associated metallophosphoesterase
MITIAEYSITCQTEDFILTNQRALFWKKENALVLSDLHVGKAATFRKSGIPISKAVLEDDLNRLHQLILHFNAEKLIIVGDLFHAEHNTDIDYFENWLASFRNLKVELILGNHDKLKSELYNRMNLTVFQPKKDSEHLSFVHDAVVKNTKQFTVSGHTHPGVVIKGKARQRLKLPCYQITDLQLILPAFSLFTGLNVINPPKNCKNIAFTNAMIFEV